MPISKFQSDVLRLLAAQRSADSSIAGGIAINRQGPRFSGDIYIFHDSVEPQGSAVKADEAALAAAGYTITWPPTQRTGKHEATIEKTGEQMQLEWATDCAFRFFPTQPDELFGYVLHPVDLATNKAAAAADRRVPRDVVDLVTIHENILPLGAVVAAAVGKFPGTTPEEMPAEITRHSRFTAEEFQVLATGQPVDLRDLHRHIRSMIEAAEGFNARLPSDVVGVGVVILDGDGPVQPDVNALDRYQCRPGAPRGVWPTSPDIAHAMLERFSKSPPPEQEPESDRSR
jgi:hypothetical protein